MKAICMLIAFQLSNLVSSSQLIVKDNFGRSLGGEKIVLVDWEGYMANPAIKLTVEAPAGASFPVTVNLSANGSRLYFDMPSFVGASGPSKTITLINATPVPFYLAIFPDRAGGDEAYVLHVNSTFGNQDLDIKVIDQDSANPVIDFPIVLDFSKDNPAYNFFADQAKGTIVRQAAEDWAFFMQNMNFDPVAVNNEWTYIWNDEGSVPDGYWTLNSSAYTGFLLYPHGTHTNTHHSGGAPSNNDFQKINGVPTQLRRSGTYEAEVHGNYNTLGWDLSINDNTWYTATNFGNVPNDLYSIAMHEMGHAYCFNPGYPVFQNYKSGGTITNAAVVAYQGSAVTIDPFDHLSNGATNDALKLVDRLSKKGTFGSEYAAVVPYGRWLITKLNLLCLQAIGYSIKQTSAFVPPSITPTALPSAVIGSVYNSMVATKGGIPFYKFEVISGVLPAGLTINSFDGTIAGTPTQNGTSNFTIRVNDYDNQHFDQTLSITVAAVYTFTGNGLWSNAANWSNGLIPPLPLPAGGMIVIDPLPGGECIYTGTLQLPTGTNLKVAAGKVFRIQN
jgi:hypothetical protein